MSGLPTLRYRYMGEGVFEALPHFRERCDKELVCGEVYSLGIIEERSSKSHSHYFASLKQAFDNMPDRYGFMNVEHMRKWTLIRTGWCHIRSHILSTEQDAAETYKALAEDRTGMDGHYDIIEHKGRVVTIYRAMSQSVRSMGKEDFQLSKTAVLDYVAGLLETSRRELEDVARRVA